MHKGFIKLYKEDLLNRTNFYAENRYLAELLKYRGALLAIENAETLKEAKKMAEEALAE